MIIRNAVLRGREGAWDVVIDDGVFRSVVRSADARANVPHDGGTDGGGPDDGETYDGETYDGETYDGETYDAGGRMLVEPFVDAHVHLDYANTAGVPRVNRSGTLFEAIEIWAERKRRRLDTEERVHRDALTAARWEAAHGTGFVRCHVDVTDPDLVALRALLRLREEVRDWLEIQLVAFPQNTVLSFPDGPRLLERALEMGADAVGGIPHNEATREDGVASLRIVFDLAERYGVPVDVHCDEIDDEQSRFVEEMAALATRYRLGRPVTASHCVAMAYYGSSYLAKLTPKLVAADLGFAVCPTENLQLQGWGMTPVPRGVAPVAHLTEAGLNVAFGQDSIADPFYPLGEGNMLRILDAGLHVGHMLTDEHLTRALDLITRNGARNLGITDRYGIEEGKPAHAIVLDCADDTSAVRHQADVVCSIRHGRTVFVREPASYSTTMPGFAPE